MFGQWVGLAQWLLLVMCLPSLGLFWGPEFDHGRCPMHFFFFLQLSNPLLNSELTNLIMLQNWKYCLEKKNDGVFRYYSWRARTMNNHVTSYKLHNNYKKTIKHIWSESAHSRGINSSLSVVVLMQKWSQVMRADHISQITCCSYGLRNLVYRFWSLFILQLSFSPLQLGTFTLYFEPIIVIMLNNNNVWTWLLIQV